MSAVLSGLNIKNIFEYYTGNSYSKYDIVDFQLTTGISAYPSYTGFGQSGLTTWFNNDLLNNFSLDANFNVSGWINLVSGSGSLKQTSNDENSRPYIDFNEYYIDIYNKQSLSGTGFASNSRTIFLTVNAGNISYINQTQKLIKFGLSSDYGFIKLSGENTNGNAVIFIDDQQFNAPSYIYDTKNIYTIIQDSSANVLKLRQNGIYVGSINSFSNYWKNEQLILGDNNDNKSLKYYELIHFTGILKDEEIDWYEKYLFEKYFDNKSLYYAKQNVPQGINYSPISFTGADYWTRNINDLFKISYGSNASFSSKLSNLMMGDGYQSNIAKNINTLNSNFSINYDGLTDTQAKCLIAYFENTPEANKKSLYEGFKGVELDLFSPYKPSAELYFKKIDHTTPYNNINNVKIEAESLYDSSLDYKGMLVQLDEIKIRTYTDTINQLKYNDVFYYNSDSFLDRGYYFYTGENFITEGSNIAFPVNISPENSPTGENSWFTKSFYFKGEIDYSLNNELRLRVNDSKNSTIEYDKDGINYNLLEFNINFNRRTNSEAMAILKFLDDKAGYKPFQYTLPQPYNKTINVYCPEWNHVYNFYNNNDISVKFKEIKAPLKFTSSFNTDIYFSI